MALICKIISVQRAVQPTSVQLQSSELQKQNEFQKNQFWRGVTRSDKNQRRTIIPPWQTIKFNGHLWQTAQTLPVVPSVTGLAFPRLCFPTSRQNDETLENLIWIQHCVIETHLPWWMEPKCGGLDGGREMIRCSYKLLAASFVFLMVPRWSRDWHENALTAAWWMLHRFYWDCLGFGGNLQVIWCH